MKEGAGMAIAVGKRQHAVLRVIEVMNVGNDVMRCYNISTRLHA
jgi:hypothetical protein